jgi:nucleotide-binding universal stress UspA family protein
MLRGILIGLDGSSSSSAAAELGIRWARVFKALLFGLGVVDQPRICHPEPTGIGGSAYKRHQDDLKLAEAHRQVEEFLKQFAAQCDAGIAWKTAQTVGHPYEQILLEGERFDLILLGQHPRFHFETQERDTDTIRKVVKNSPHPVVIVPERLPAGDRIVVAYDGSPAAARALQAFVASGLGERKEVDVLSVHPEREVAERQAERAAEYLRLHDIPVRSRAVATRANPAEVLLDEAQPHKVGLLVMGAYSRSRLCEFLRGSTTRTILRHSPVPTFLCH